MVLSLTALMRKTLSSLRWLLIECSPDQRCMPAGARLPEHLPGERIESGLRPGGCGRFCGGGRQGGAGTRAADELQRTGELLIIWIAFVLH